MTRDELQKINLPDEPGVYLFRDARRNILYIGKAASLRDRVRSYFSKDLGDARSPAIVGMVEKATTVSYERTDSVLEALILEANLIKKHEPPYNIEQKDNKSFNYLVLTKEEFPRVLVVRGRELFQKWSDKEIQHLFGPFPQGGSLKEALKLVRRIFPYRDRCTPCQGDTMICKPCFNRQLGLCPGVCSGEMDAKGYKEVIRNIVELFGGGMRSLKRRLDKEMKDASKEEDFEEAEILRRQVRALTHIRDVSLIKDEYRASAGGSFRIEAYDVAHTAGAETVGVMTVVSGGEALKSDYRMFKIRSVTNDDLGALKEMLQRRLAHPEWQMPKLVVTDGGKVQLNTAKRVFEKAGVVIPIVGVVKDEFHRPREVLGDQKLAKAYEKDILFANDEAHRFAIGYHRRRQRKRMV
jgi:excinuclease ABC subunit C